MKLTSRGNSKYNIVERIEARALLAHETQALATETREETAAWMHDSSDINPYEDFEIKAAIALAEAWRDRKSASGNTIVASLGGIPDLTEDSQ